MARLPFTDTHVHFFDLAEPEPGLRYDWLGPAVPPDGVLGDYRAMASGRYWADDLLAETRFANVDRVVHVQAAIGTEDPVVETRWLQAFAEHQPLTVMADAARALVLGAGPGQDTGGLVLGSLLWSAALVAVFAPIAVAAYNRR